MVNANGNHRGRGAATEDRIPPCLDVELEIRCPEAPRSVTLQPAHEPLASVWRDGVLTVRAGRVDLHAIVEADWGAGRFFC